jgi:FimV-like protein
LLLRFFLHIFFDRRAYEPSRRSRSYDRSKTIDVKEDISVRYMAPALILTVLLVPDWSRNLGRAADATQPYITQSGDTLGDIARRYLRDETISPYQMMLALFQTNPEAFADDNINNLKVGYSLRLPARETILATGAEDAEAIVKRQHALWLQSRSPPAAAAPPILEGPGERPGETPGAEPAVLAPTAPTHPPSPGAPGAESAPAALAPRPHARLGEDADMGPVDADEHVDRLRRDLALAREQAAQSGLESEALRARVAALEARLTKLDDRLAEQQAAPRRQQRPAAAPTSEAPPTASGDDAAGTSRFSTDRVAARSAMPQIVVLASAVILVGLLLIWRIKWRARGRERKDVKPGPDAMARPGAAAPTMDDELAVGSDDLGLASGAVSGAPSATGTAGITRAELIIDLDDLELAPAPHETAAPYGGVAPSGPANTASTSRKAEAEAP